MSASNIADVASRHCTGYRLGTPELVSSFMFEQESYRWPNQPTHRRSAPLYEPKVCPGLGPVLRSGALLPALLGDLC